MVKEYIEIPGMIIGVKDLEKDTAMRIVESVEEKENHQNWLKDLEKIKIQVYGVKNPDDFDDIYHIKEVK